jgi:hypothetical protein
MLGFILPGLRDIDITTFAQAEGQRLGSEHGHLSPRLGASRRALAEGSLASICLDPAPR